ncbi:hypothetical protein OPQ81_001144 [Rhizoctonia solani]|nr:hypothetical protein OPQ81_001144 [Rhizoctonia solani]
MEGVNPGARRSEGLCENIIVSTSGVEMRVHLHVFDKSPFDILLGQPWKSQYLLQERRNSSTLEMTIRDYQDSSRQVEVVLRNYSDPNWDAQLDSLQVPRIHRPPPDPEAHNHSHPSHHHFDRQSSGVSPSSKGGMQRRSSGRAQRTNGGSWRKGVQGKDRGQFPEDPVATLPELPTEPPPIAYGERLTKNRFDVLDLGKTGFLWPEEIKLFAHILLINEKALAFDETEKGRFRDDYFSPYRIATVPHEPWQEKPIPIAPGIWPKVLALVKQKLGNGTYKWSQSSYRGRIFPVLKKDGSPRLVHDMQRLNTVTIHDSTLPPNIEDVVESLRARLLHLVRYIRRIRQSHAGAREPRPYIVFGARVRSTSPD